MSDCDYTIFKQNSLNRFYQAFVSATSLAGVMPTRWQIPCERMDLLIKCASQYVQNITMNSVVLTT